MISDTARQVILMDSRVADPINDFNREAAENIEDKVL
jgi:hypothetical protein